jgi:hypothetical protein
LVFCPTRASSANQISIGLPPSWAESAATSAGNFFKRLGALRVVGIMARAGRELAIVHGPQLPTEPLRRDGQTELIPDPRHEGDQAPAQHTVEGRYGPLLDNVAQRRALCGLQNGGAARGLSVDEPVRALVVGAHHPVAHDLQPHAGELGGVGAGVSVVDGGERQETSGLIGIARVLGEGTKGGGIEVGAQGDRGGHRDLGRGRAAANHISSAKAIPAQESASSGGGITASPRW